MFLIQYHPGWRGSSSNHPNKSVQATAAALFVFDSLGFSVVIVSFLSLGPASVPDLYR
jgi:hypothetical protein